MDMYIWVICLEEDVVEAKFVMLSGLLHLNLLKKWIYDI